MIKIGRNDACWCGSGKKYKQCHEEFDHRIEMIRKQGHKVPEHKMIKTPEQILKHPAHAYTRCLIHAIPTLRGELPRGLPGQPPLNGPAETGCDFSPRCPYRRADCAEVICSLRDVGDGHLCSCVLSEGGVP